MNKFYALVISLFLVGCEEAKYQYRVYQDKVAIRDYVDRGQPSDAIRACKDGNDNRGWDDHNPFMADTPTGYKLWFKEETQVGVKHFICYYDHSTKTANLVYQ